MKNKILMFWFIVLLVIGSVALIWNKASNDNIKLGLDLVGGSRIVIEAQKTEVVPVITQDVMNSLKYVVNSRVNPKGVSEIQVQQTGADRILIEIPNNSDLEKTKKALSETAELEFKRPVRNKSGVIVDWKSTGLTGKDLEKASVSSSTKDSGWAISLQFKPEGARKFGDLTRELVGDQMAIFFNGKLESAPVINEPIPSGQAQITGNYTYETAKEQVDWLNAGALPVPTKVIQINTVGPTLGADSIAKSEFAGAIGLGLVMIFMLIVYRVPGIVADLALIIYGIITFAAFQVAGVTLTLAGIAGFILSVGMAVDANVLIFERTKEELKAGRTLFTAINTGFDRAFSSIFDSNMTTILTCAVLYFKGTTIIKGFALTLAIGVIVSMFTAITVSRNFMHLFFGTGQLKHPEWFGLKKDEIEQGYTATETKREDAKFGVLE